MIRWMIFRCSAAGEPPQPPGEDRQVERLAVGVRAVVGQEEAAEQVVARAGLSLPASSRIRGVRISSPAGALQVRFGHAGPDMERLSRRGGRSRPTGRSSRGRE